jgi:hypothetical protein
MIVGGKIDKIVPNKTLSDIKVENILKYRTIL